MKDKSTKDLQKEYALKQLVKIADMMECCEPGTKEYKELQKDYRAFARVAMPEAFKSKK